ncbi:MAG: hypothetical protein ABSC42_10200 [Tepidisphaeraceae bacterium]
MLSTRCIAPLLPTIPSKPLCSCNSSRNTWFCFCNAARSAARFTCARK